MLSGSEHSRRVLWWLTGLIFAGTGAVVALAEWGVIFREALMVGAAALIPTILIDTFLYNEFLIRTGCGFWVILYAFLLCQSVLVAAGIRYLFRVVSQSADDNHPSNEDT